MGQKVNPHGFRVGVIKDPKLLTFSAMRTALSFSLASS